MWEIVVKVLIRLYCLLYMCLWYKNDELKGIVSMKFLGVLDIFNNFIISDCIVFLLFWVNGF